MKFKFHDLSVIHGGVAASSDVNPVSSQAVLPGPDARNDSISVAAEWGAASPGDLEAPALQFRSFDSLPLLGESGVIRVGVNDLGWVVYDWAPGP